MKLVRESLNAINEVYGPPSSMSMIGNNLAHEVFGSWSKGTYNEDTNYMYGQTHAFQDGITEKGYTVDIYELRLQGEFLGLSFCNKAAKDELFTLIDQKLPHKYTSMDGAGIIIKEYKGISSSKKERSVYVFVGTGRSNSDMWQTSEQLFINQKNFSKLGKLLQKSLKSRCEQLIGKDLVVQFFNNYIGALDMLPKVKKEESSSSHDMGYGSQASTKVRYVINNGYSVKRYVKKYGEESLTRSINKCSYFRDKTFKGIKNGILLTDESWTDTYD